MKQSKFNVLIEPKESPNKAILYNTLHDHRLVIENEDNNISDFFKKIQNSEILTPAEQENAEMFKEMGILLDDEVDEKQLFDDWYDCKIQNAQGMLNIILVTTMACNLRCPYCYEKNQLDNSRLMTEETASSVVAWIKEQARTRAIKTLKITYFGGEPLMNKKVLFQMSQQLKDFSDLYGLEYDAGMITNGVLLTPDVAAKLRQVGLKWFKVTLDGDRPGHNQTRITSSGRGTFDEVFSNLEQANENLKSGEEPLKINIGGNFTDETYQYFVPLLDRIAASNFKQYIGQFNLKPVQELTMENTEGQERYAVPCGTKCFNEDNTEKMLKLREELQRRDLPAIDGLNFGPCDFYRGDSYSIGMDGAIYTCPADFDIKEHAIGHVNAHKSLENKSQYDATFKKWQNTKPWTPDCYDCSFLPVCTGGCQAKAYVEGYDWNSVVCEKEYFKRMSVALTKELLDIAPHEQETLQGLASIVDTQIKTGPTPPMPLSREAFNV